MSTKASQTSRAMNEQNKEEDVKKASHSVDFLNYVLSKYNVELVFSKQLRFHQVFAYKGENVRINQIAESLHITEETLSGHLRPIYKKLETIQNCPLSKHPSDKGKAVAVYDWLWKTEWPEYEAQLTPSPQPISPSQFTTLDQCWRELKKKKTPNKTIKISKRATLQQSRVIPIKEKLPEGSEFNFKIKLDLEAENKNLYLILLERDATGNVFCLCPSEYAPNSKFDNNEIILPQYPPSPEEFFEASVKGEEQIIGIVTDNLLNLPWLQEANKEVKELNLWEFQNLLIYLDRNLPYQVYFTQFLIT